MKKVYQILFTHDLPVKWVVAPSMMKAIEAFGEENIIYIEVMLEEKPDMWMIDIDDRADVERFLSGLPDK